MTRRTSTLLAAALTVLTAACSVRPAPSSPPAVPTPTVPGSAVPSLPIASITPAPDPSPPSAPGTTVNLDCDEPLPCNLSLFDADGVPMPGWPIQLDGFCSGATTDASGRVFVGCDGGDAGSTLHGFDATAAVVDGWPVSLPAPMGVVTLNDFTAICGRVLPPIVVAGEGTLYLTTWDESQRLLHAFDPTGQERAGWPQALPGDSVFGCGGFALLADGTVRAWGYEGMPPAELGLGYGPFAQRTVFTAFAPDGATLPGWPFGSTGTGSGAVIAADGTLYHVSEAGNVWAHSADGEPKPGWPYRLEGRLMSPYLAPDGRLVLVSVSFSEIEILALDPDGAVAPGWPRRLLVDRASPCVVLGDNDCDFLVEPAFGPDGTLYLALAPIADGLGGSILALDPDGLVPQGWPFQLPDRTHAAGLTVDGAGNVIVSTATCGDLCWETAEYGELRLSPAGELHE